MEFDLKATVYGPNGPRTIIRQRGKSYNPLELVVEPAEIAACREEEAKEKARKTLEGEALMSFSALSKNYEREALRRRSDAELRTFIAAVSKILEGSGV